MWWGGWVVCGMLGKEIKGGPGCGGVWEGVVGWSDGYCGSTYYLRDGRWMREAVLSFCFASRCSLDLRRAE